MFTPSLVLFKTWEFSRVTYLQQFAAIAKMSDGTDIPRVLRSSNIAGDMAWTTELGPTSYLLLYKEVYCRACFRISENCFCLTLSALRLKARQEDGYFGSEIE
jgi:hypothetical protein